MNKIQKLMFDSFHAGKERRKANDEICHEDGYVVWRYHGNAIVRAKDGVIEINNHDWTGISTMGRLRAFGDVVNINGELYLDGHVFEEGSWNKIDKSIDIPHIQSLLDGLKTTPALIRYLFKEFRSCHDQNGMQYIYDIGRANHPRANFNSLAKQLS